MPVPKETSKPQRTPQQARSKKTVARILDATAAVLASASFEGLTTHKVAAEAGVNIATVYAYFPNKVALVEGLLQRFDALLLESLDGSLDINEPEDLELALETGMRLMRREPWILQMSVALRSSPELLPLRSASLKRMTGFARTSGALKTGRTTAQREAAIHLAVETIATGLQLAAAEKSARRRRALMTELTTLIRGYLAASP